MLSLKLNHNISQYLHRLISSVVPIIEKKTTNWENEPVLEYREGSEEKKKLREVFKRISSECCDIPIVIGGKEIRTKQDRYQVMPHCHQNKVARFYEAETSMIQEAIKTCVEAQIAWQETDIHCRVNIWNRAAELMSKKYRQDLNAATMIGQSKTLIQAEIDSAVELIDFIRYNAACLTDIVHQQPISPKPEVSKNSYRLRGLEGFVASIAPFNFTAIAGNLTYTPALMGNCVLFKPSSTAILSNYLIFKIMQEAGVPPGVVNFIPCVGKQFGDAITTSPHLAAVNFTGSSETFKTIWKQVGNNIDHYNNFPKLVGECGGKNFHFVHPSAHVDTVIATTVRSAFEYSGQKCSACSRLYVPESLWPKIKNDLVQKTTNLCVDDVCNLSAFMSAVIDEAAFQKCISYIDYAKQNQNTELLTCGVHTNDIGYFIQPTIIVTKNPNDKLMKDEIFGPILTVFVYKDSDIQNAIELAKCSKYALTGSIFAQDEQFLAKSLQYFEMNAGNLYLNDKSTGAVVGQQPFGGSRLSGTNDKAGGPHYILRFSSPQTIKETFVPQTDIEYPYQRD